MKEYFRNIYLAISTILVGMSVTFRRMLQPSVTLQYPHEKMEVPKGSRNKLFNIIDECNGCSQCVRACPVNCIVLETVQAFEGEDLGETSDGSKKRLHVTRYDIDMGKCCYCGLCTYPCPTQAIVMTDEYEYSTYERDGLIFKFATYTPEQVAELKRRDEIRKKEKAAKKAAAAKAKAEAAAKKAAEESAKPAPEKPAGEAADSEKTTE